MLQLLLYSSVIAVDTQGCMAPSIQGCFADPYKGPNGLSNQVLDFYAAVRKSDIE